jgi:hypothetical protein
MTQSLMLTLKDLAIAAYLVTLWEDAEEKPKSFIDLGCGNGLLVYLLTKEGYPGVGLVILTTTIDNINIYFIFFTKMKQLSDLLIRVFEKLSWGCWQQNLI